jgi:hypothetical protein
MLGARTAFRFGFAAAAFLVALRAVAAFTLGFVDCFFAFAVFDFGEAALALRRVALAGRFLAAAIAAPEIAPIAVPTTGMPRAVPARAPATAPPKVLLAVPSSDALASWVFSLSSILLSLTLIKKTVALVRPTVNHDDLAHVNYLLFLVSYAIRRLGCRRNSCVKGAPPLAAGRLLSFEQMVIFWSVKLATLPHRHLCLDRSCPLLGGFIGPR